jgi:cytochrome c
MKRKLGLTLFAGAIAFAAALPAQAANPCNPCAAKNPCAANAKLDPALITRPAGTRLAGGKHEQLAKEGKKLWSDKALSPNGLSCATCHAGNASFSPGFAQPYPHRVAMAEERFGLKQVRRDEMVQGCMVMAMAAKPLPWDSRQLAALTAYVGNVQKTFKPVAASAANPCAAKNPCAMKNPCAAKAANPCAMGK